MLSNIAYLGEILALATAIVWAFAVILFKKSGETVHPIALNVYKNTLAGLLLIPTIYIFGETLFRPAPPEDYLLLLLSGILGIGIADTLFFMCLNLIGAGMTAIVDCMYSPFIIGLSILWIDESMSVFQIVGVVLIISAILTATRKKGRGNISRRDMLLGLLYGVLGMGTMAVGIVMIKPLLDRSPLLWVTEIRLVGGLVVLIILLLFNPRRKAIMSTALTTTGWKYTFFGSLMGTYLALMLWLGGMKFTKASIAAALNQTSNIWIFIFAAILLKERINLLKSIGILLAVAGVFLVMYA